MDGEDSNAEKSIIISKEPSPTFLGKTQNLDQKSPGNEFRESVKKNLVNSFKQLLSKFEDLDTRNTSLREVQRLIEYDKHKNYLEVYIKCLSEHKKSSSPYARKQEVSIYSFLAEVYKETLRENIKGLKIIEKIANGILKYFHDINSDVQNSAAEAFCSIFRFSLSEEYQKKVFVLMFDKLDRNFTTSDVNVQQTAALTIFKWAVLIDEMDKGDYLGELFKKTIPLFLSLRSEFFFLLSSMGFMLERCGFEPVMSSLNRILYKINSYFNNPSGDKKLKLEACCLLLYISDYLMEIEYKGLENQLNDIIIKSLKKLKTEKSRLLSELVGETTRVWKNYYKFLCEIYENPRIIEKSDKAIGFSKVINGEIKKTEKNYIIYWGKEKKRYLKKGDGNYYCVMKKEDADLGNIEEPIRNNEKLRSNIVELKFQPRDCKISKNNLSQIRSSNSKFHLIPKSNTIKAQPIDHNNRIYHQIKCLNIKELFKSNSVKTLSPTKLDVSYKKPYFKGGELKNPDPVNDILPIPIQNRPLKARTFSITSDSPKELQIKNDPKFFERVTPSKNSGKGEISPNLLIYNQGSVEVRPRIIKKNRNFSIDTNFDFEKLQGISVSSTKASHYIKTPRQTFSFTVQNTPKNQFRISNTDSNNNLTLISIIQLKNERVLKFMVTKFESINKKLDSTQSRILKLNKILESKREIFEQRRLNKLHSLNSLKKNKKESQFFFNHPRDLTYHWSEIIELIEHGQTAEGIFKLLNLKDDLYLLRLMLNNNDFLRLVPGTLGKELIKRLLNVLDSRFFEKMSLGWIQNADSLGLLKVIDKNTLGTFMKRFKDFDEPEESI